MAVVAGIQGQLERGDGLIVGLVEPAIRIDGLTRDFGLVRAVDHLDLQVAPGRVFGFLGPNGAGKTTTMHVLLGLLAPTTGSVRVLGLDPAREGRQVRSHCGALLEHNGVYERLSAMENLEFQGRTWDMRPDDIRQRSRELLTGFDLWDRRDEKAGTWSKGMKQKLALARTLLHRPRLVFLDEPTNGLDPVSSVELRDGLRQAARDEGLTVFLATHNLHEAERTCDEVAVLRRGRLLAQGAPHDLLGGGAETLVEIHTTGRAPDAAGVLGGRPDVVSVEADGDHLRVRLSAGAPVAPIVRALVESGLGVEEVHKEQIGLEDAFLRLMAEEDASGEVVRRATEVQA